MLSGHVYGRRTSIGVIFPIALTRTDLPEDCAEG
jgi:hypothetical protein